MLKKILFGVLIAAFIGFLVYGYMYINRIKQPTITATEMIPSDNEFVLVVNHFPDFIKKISQDNLIFEEIENFDFFKKMQTPLASIDSIFQSNEEAKKLLNQNSMYAAAFKEGVNWDYLCALNLKDATKTEDAKTFLTGISDVNNSKEDPVTKEIYLEIEFAKVKLFLYVKEGVVLFTGSEALLLKSLGAKGNKSINLNKQFVEFESSRNKDSDIHLFIENGKLETGFLKAFSGGLVNAAYAKNTGVTFSSFDFQLNPNTLQGNGLVFNDTTEFCNFVKSLVPQEFELADALPANTVGMIYLANNSVFNDVDFNNDADMLANWTSICSNETADFAANFNDTIKSFSVIKLNSEEEANSFLQANCDSSKILFGADSVRYLKAKTLINKVTSHFVNVAFKCVYLKQNYLYLANSATDMRYLYSYLYEKKTLLNNEEFNLFYNGNLSKEVGLMFYLSGSGAGEYYKNLMDSKFEQRENLSNLLNKFSSIGFQMSSYKGKLVTQLYAVHGPEVKQAAGSVWECVLDTVANYKTQIVLNHKNSSNELVTQDLNNNLYLISNTGKILWKKNLESQIMSEIQQVDYFENGKLQMLFNTKNYLHLIDRNGNYVEGYPVKLKAEASNGAVVFDYDGNRDYRILIACKDLKLYNYKVDGKLIDGFEFGKTQDEVNIPVQYFKQGTKDYLLFYDKSGNVYLTGRRGDTRANISNKVYAVGHNFYLDVGKDLSKTYLYTFSETDKVLRKLSLANKTNDLKIETDINPKFYQFDLINEDKLVDLLIADESGFNVYDDAGKVLLNYVSKTAINPKISYYSTLNQRYFSYVESESGNLTVLDVSLQSSNALSMKSTNNLNMCNLYNDGYYYFVNQNDKYLSCILFTENSK